MPKQTRRTDKANRPKSRQVNEEEAKDVQGGMTKAELIPAKAPSIVRGSPLKTTAEDDWESPVA